MNQRFLFIDGANLGPVIGYRQNPERKAWFFLMAAGYYIVVEWITIKSFDSCGDLTLILYH